MKYKVSKTFEINNVEDNRVYISSDFSTIYVADDISSFIIDMFEPENTIECVHNDLSSVKGFNLQEYEGLIKKIIEYKIIIPSDE